MLTISVSAFEFNGEERSIKDVYVEWFQAQADFLSGNSSFEDLRNANIRFQTDLIGSNYFPGSDAELEGYMSEIEQRLSAAVDGTDNQVDDTLLDIFGKTVETLGIFDFRSQFEDWYQEKYGKEYGKHDNAFGSDFDTHGSSYYIFFHDSSHGWEYRYYLNPRETPIVPSVNSTGAYKFQLPWMDYIAYSRYLDVNGNWSEWTTDGVYYVNSGTSSWFTFDHNIHPDCDSHVTATNLPFDYGDGNVSDDPYGDLIDTGDTDSGLTPEEYIDLLNQLIQDLIDSMPDLSSLEGILRAIYAKCCSIDGKLNRQQQSDLKDLINAAVVSLSNSNNEGVDRIVAALGDVSSDMGSYDDTELLAKIDELNKLVESLGLSDEDIDFDLASMSALDKAKMAALSGLVNKLNDKIPVIRINTSLDTIRTVVFNDVPPEDFTFTINFLDSNIPITLLSTDFFQNSDVRLAVNIAKNFTSCIIFCVWLLSMRKKLVSMFS